MTTKFHNNPQFAPDDHGPHAPAIVPGRIDSTFVTTRPVNDGEESAGIFTPASFLNSLRRRWLSTLLLGLLLGAIAATAAWFAQRPQYQAFATLRIASRPSSLVYESENRNRATDFDMYRKTHRELLLGQFVLSNALGRDNVKNLPVVQRQINPTEWLRSKLRVTFQGDSELMQVSMWDEDKTIIHLLVNNVVEAYMEDVVDAEMTETRKLLKGLEDIQIEKENELATLRTDAERIAATSGADQKNSAATDEQSKMARLTSLQSEINKVELELLKAQAEQILVPSSPTEEDSPELPNSEKLPEGVELRMTAKIPVDLIADSDLDAASFADPESQSLRDQIAKKRLFLEDVKQLMTPAKAKADIEKNQAEIVKLDERLNDRREKLRDELALKLLREKERSGKVLDIQISLLKKQKETLSAELKQIQFGGSKTTVELEKKQAQIASTERILDEIKQKYERMNIELKATSRVRPQSPAVAPTAPNPMAALPMALAAGLAGFFVPVLLILFGDARQQIVSSPMQVIDTIGLPILGQVPHIPRSHRILRDSGSRQDEYQDRLHEAVDGVAAMLIRWGENRPSRVIMVSSAVAGEGKTTLAGHLSISLAAAGNKTLLIDFDLRRPVLHDSFGQELEPGVGNLCEARGIDLAATMRETGFPNLTLIPAGNCPANSLTTLSKERLGKLFEQLKSQFDYLIVDSSPILQSVDARLIGRHVDGVVLSLLRDVSRMPKVTNACEMLRTYHIPMLGSVLLGSSTDVYYTKRRPLQSEATSASA
ncbi:MAG: polysaccharide biosynthesis tyrosine autokinase [Planctomycetaceae bacterium]